MEVPSESTRKTESPRDAFNRVVLKMFEGAVKKKDRRSAESLVFTAIDGVMMAIPRKKADGARTQIAEQIEIQLDRMFRTIIEFDDHDLFKSALHDLTLTITQSVSRLAAQLEASIWNAVGPLSSDPERQRVGELLRFDLTYSGREFQRILQIPDLLADLKSGNVMNLGEKLEDVRSDALAFYANCLLLRMFFMVTVSLLFKYSQRRIDSGELASYLNELWHHTTPSDADAMILNVTPVPRDPLWLTLLYLYGGSNNSLWGEHYDFEDFHGTKKYIVQSYLLGLSKIAQTIPAPSDSQISRLAELKMWAQLDELYEFTGNVLYEMNDQKFTLELQKLPELQLDEFVSRNRPVKEGFTWYQDLLKIIRKAREDYTHAKGLIEAFLQLDETKRTGCITGISQAYRGGSLVEDAGIQTPCTSSKDLDSLRTFSRTYTSVPKHCFLKAANVDCSMVWGEMGSDIALRENMHIYEAASAASQQSVTMRDYDPDLIFETVAAQVKKMISAKNAPNLAFLPLDLLMDWTKTFKIRHDPGPTLTFPGAKLKLVNSWQGWPFRDVVMINKNNCRWLYEEFKGGRLDTSIVQDKTGSTVEISLCTRGILIPGPESVSCVRLSRLPEPE